MKTKKSEFAERFTIGVKASVVSAIQKSGQSGPDWFRQAAQSRLDDEQQAETPISNLEKQLKALKQQTDSLKESTQRELVKLQQSEAITQATLVEVRKTLTQIQRNQAAFHEMLARLDQSFGESLEQLGQSLLNALSQQLRERVKVPEEPPVKQWPPAPPRTRL